MFLGKYRGPNLSLHSSDLDHKEEYLTARGHKNVSTSQLNGWRREHMSNLLNAFDFENVSLLPCSTWLLLMSN